MTRFTIPNRPQRSLAVTRVALSVLFLAGLLAVPGCTSRTSAQPVSPDAIEPDAGRWETWVLESGEQLRLPAPPDATATRGELAKLREHAAARGDEQLAQIRFWNTGAPGYRWNQIALQEVHDSDLFLHTYRLVSYMNVAIYDATVAAWDSKFAHSRPRPAELDAELATALRTPSSPSYPSEHAVAAGAAEAVLTYFLPDRAEKLRARAEEAAEAFVLAGVHYPSDVAAGLELGRQVGALVVERAMNDGSDAVWEGARPTGYGTYALESIDDEMIGTWQTWVLESGSEFRPPPPPDADSEQRRAEIAELLAAQEERDTNPASELFFWPEDPAGRPEPGAAPVTTSQIVYYYAPFNTTLWLTELNQKLFEYRWIDDPPRAAYAYALVGVAFYDAFVATWDGRFAYWVARPTEWEPAIQPILPTYTTPEYPSGHAAIATASTEALAYLFPADAHYFRSRTRELAESRIWAGIHFRSAVDAGLELGTAVARKVIAEKGIEGP